MKNLTVLIFLTLFINSPAFSQDLNIVSLFISSDTSSEINAFAVEESFYSYWSNLDINQNGIKIEVSACLGDGFENCVEEKIDALLGLSPLERDNTVVVLHLYDHGVNGGSTLPLTLSKRGVFDPEEEILNRLNEQFRFVVLLVDACNNLAEVPDEFANLSRGSAAEVKPSDWLSKKYLRESRPNRKFDHSPAQLWLSKGYLAISTSRVGQRATFHRNYGGYGSQLFYQTLRLFQEEKQQRWVDVLSEFSKAVDLARQHEVMFFGTIDGKVLESKNLFLPVNRNLTLAEKREYLKSFKGKPNESEVLESAIAAAKKFCDIENNRFRDSKGLEEVTINNKKIPHYDEYFSSYPSLEDYVPRIAKVGRRRNNSFFATDSIKYLGLYYDEILLRGEPVFLYEVPKVVHTSSETDTLAHVIGVQVDPRFEVARINVPFFKRAPEGKVDRIINFPKPIVSDTAQVLPDTPIVLPIPSIDRIALDSFLNDYVNVVQDYYSWKRYIAANFKDRTTIDEAKKTADKIFSDQADSLQTSVYLPEGEILKNTFRPYELLFHLYDLFSVRYDSVHYQFCLEELEIKTMQDYDVHFEVIKEGKAWKAYLKFTQHFVGFRRSRETYFDRTNKIIEFSITRTDGETATPTFDISIESVKVLETMDENFCEPPPKA